MLKPPGEIRPTQNFSSFNELPAEKFEYVVGTAILCRDQQHRSWRYLKLEF